MIYAEIDTSKRVLQSGEGDALPPNAPDGSLTYRELAQPINWGSLRPTEQMMWPDADPAPSRVETAPLADRINEAIAKCYTDIDAIYADAVGNRTEEYKDAESDARAFKAAGYTGTASDYVHDFALHNPTGTEQTDQWAADQIIARADAFASAKLSMRSQRFASQSAMRAAATNADLDATVAAWHDFIATTRQNLGLPPAP